MSTPSTLNLYNSTVFSLLIIRPSRPKVKSEQTEVSNPRTRTTKVNFVN